MKRNIKQQISDVKDGASQATQKAGDIAEDKFDDTKQALKRGRSKLKKL